MKYILFFSLFIGILSCDRHKMYPYSDTDYIRFLDTSAFSKPYITQKSGTVSETAPIDTVYFDLQLIGNLSDKDRKFGVETFIGDSTVVEAVAGIHYISFDDLSVEKMMVLHADSTVAKLPVIILYDPERPSYSSTVLFVRLVDTDDLVSSKTTLREGKLTISNQ